jgi:hypothetical protein
MVIKIGRRLVKPLSLQIVRDRLFQPGSYDKLRLTFLDAGPH